jgi:hypothetical protein
MITSPCDYQNKRRSELRLGLAVKSFSDFSPKMLLSMKEDLSLSMTVEELAFCQGYYRNPPRPQPLLDEIYFLDGIAAGNHRSLSHAVLPHAYSGSAEETDRDLILKLQSGSKRFVKSPPMLSDRLHALSDALHRSGKQNPLPTLACAAELYTALAYAAVGLVPRDLLSVKGTASSVRIFAGDPACKDLLSVKAAENDTVLLIPYRGTPRSHADSLSSICIELLSLLARSKHYRSLVRAVRVVDERGVAVALASLHRGIFIDVSDLPSAFDGGELYDLSHAEKGAVLLAVSADHVSRLIRLISEFGLEAFPIARAIRGESLTIRKSARAPFTFRTDFLLQLASRGFTPNGDPALEEASEPSESVICRHLMRNLTATELSVSSCMRDPRSILFGRVFAASCTSDQTFLSGAYTALSAASEAVLMGGRRDSVVAYEIHSASASTSSLSALCDHALGVYRTLAELAIPSVPTCIPSKNPQNTYSAVYCCASAAHPAPMQTFRAPDSYVYLIAPRLEASGLPDYADVRSILSHFEALNKSGIILSASVGYRTSPHSTIESMSSDFGISYDTPGLSEAASRVQRGIFYIIEAKSPIEGLSHLGVTQAKSEAAMQDLPLRPEPQNNSAFPKAAPPTVWIHPLCENANLYALAVAFMKQGFSVRITVDPVSDLMKDTPEIFFLSGLSEDAVPRAEAFLNLPRVRSFLSENGLLLLSGLSASVLGDHPVLHLRDPYDQPLSGICACDPLTDTMIGSLYQKFRG